MWEDLIIIWYHVLLTGLTFNLRFTTNFKIRAYSGLYPYFERSEHQKPVNITAVILATNALHIYNTLWQLQNLKINKIEKSDWSQEDFWDTRSDAFWDPLPVMKLLAIARKVSSITSGGTRSWVAWAVAWRIKVTSRWDGDRKRCR